MTKIHTETFGAGKSIVLVHGWAMHSGIWRSFAKELAKGYRVTLVDLPGHGLSEVIAPFTLEAISKALAEAVSIESSCWLGWSLGAEVALEIAHRFPGRVSKLILLAGSPCFIRCDSWPGLDVQVLDSFAENLKQDSQSTLLKFLALQIKGLADQEAVLQELKTLVFDCPAPDPRTLQEGLAILKYSDLRAVFANLKIPAAAILGGLDTLIPVAVGVNMRDLLPEMDVIVIDRAGHVPFLSHPQAVLESVRQFMSK